MTETADGAAAGEADGATAGTLGIALCQHAPTPLDVAASLARLEREARAAAAQGAALLVVPEASLTGYNIAPADARAVAEPADGAMLARVAAIARECGIALLCGYVERTGETLANCAHLVDRHGETLVRYRKTHLWGELDASLFVAGEALAPVVELDGWRVGLLVCYDVEFPETVRRLALEGAELVLVPTALMHPFTFVADHVTRVRAAENGVFLAYANYCGEENGLRYAGRSVVVAPDGEELARAGETPVRLHARLERERLALARDALPYLRDRRAALYGPPRESSRG